jgi:putative phosphonate metabolism protein
MRFAIYYAPESNSLLHRLGSHWLGHDAFTGAGLDQPGEGLLVGKTAAAKRYGFHATLKAPFYLRQGKSEQHVKQEARQLAILRSPVIIDRLIVSEIEGFLALVPETQSAEIDSFAAACVRSFDHLRKETDAGELARRHEAGLTVRQSQYFADWGYPYIFEEFRFHVTLTKKLHGEDLRAARVLAENHFAAINGKPLRISDISIFVEPADGAQFHVLEQFPVGSSAMAAWA